MWFRAFLTRSKSRLPRGHRSQRRPARRRPQLTLEQLESRTVLSAYTALDVPTLIADINAANAAGGANTITLAAPTTSPYVLTAVDNTTDGATGLPVIAAGDSLTIVGNGDTIERSAAVGTPAFRPADVAAGASLTLGNLTLEGGLAQGSGVLAEGGGIYSQGTLTLNGAAVENNVAQGAYQSDGGAIYSYGALTLEGGTKIENNLALGGQFPANLYARFGNGLNGGTASGGGLYVAAGTATVTDSTLSGNIAQGGRGQSSIADYFFGGHGGSASGGAIYVGFDSDNAVVLMGDALSSNVALGGAGGGNGPYAKTAPLTSFAAGGYGNGGALDMEEGTLLSVVDSSFSLNTAQGGQGGGGIALYTFDSESAGGGGNAAGGALIVAAETVSFSGGAIFSNTAQGGQGGNGDNGLDGGTPGAGGAASGGGLFMAGGVYMAGGTLTGVTISDNDATGGAGGIGYKGASGGAAAGGGLYLNPGADTLARVTIAGNDATGGAGGSGKTNGAAGAGWGGGIYSYELTSLSSAINAKQTTIAMADNGVSIVPGTTILIGSEEMTVTTVQVVGSSPSAVEELTVVRGVNGTKPASHAAAAGVSSLELDAFTLANLVNNKASTGSPNIYGQYIET